MGGAVRWGLRLAAMLVAVGLGCSDSDEAPPNGTAGSGGSGGGGTGGGGTGGGGTGGGGTGGAPPEPGCIALWSNAFVGTEDLWANAIGVEQVGDIVLAGFSYGTVDFGSGPLPGEGFTFLVRFTAAGDYVSSLGTGTTSGTLGSVVVRHGRDGSRGGSSRHHRRRG